MEEALVLECITSRDNPVIKDLVRLREHRRERQEQGRFVCEGVRLCLDALGSGVKVHKVFVTSRARERWPELAPLLQAAGQQVEISEQVAKKISDTKEPQGVFALCRVLDNGQSAVTIKSGGRYLLLASLQDPGNLGTIVRTAEAFGLDGLVLSADCPDLYSPKVLRASMGGVFRLPVSVVPGMETEITRLRKGGVRVYAAALGGLSQAVKALGEPGAAAVLIGNEGNGLPEALVRACDDVVTIPMAGRAESLNAAAAASVLVWEMCRSGLLGENDGRN